MKVDTDWLKKQIERSEHGSLRAVARKMKNGSGKELDPSGLLRLVNGESEMTLSYAQQLADVLDVPVLELLKRCGMRF